LEDLVDAVKTVAGGGSIVKPAVTERLLKGLKGLNTDFSANSLGVAEGTVKNHVSNILSKLGVRDRTRAVLKAFELGFV
jgi:DNA-binding NarL/FixJ family response regulator